MKTYFRSPELTNGYTLHGYLDCHPTQLKSEGVGLMISRELLERCDEYLLPIVKDGKIGFINNYTEIVIEPIYDSINGIFTDKDDMVAVLQDHKWGVIDSVGKCIVPFEYKEATVYMKRFVILRRDDYKYLLLDTQTGKELIPAGKYTALYKRGRFIEARTKDGRGLIDVKENIIIPIQYDWIGEEEFGVIRVMNKFSGSTGPDDNFWSLYDSEGVELLPLRHRYISRPRLNNENLLVIWVAGEMIHLSDLPYDEEEDNHFHKTCNSDGDYGHHYGEYAGSYAQDVMGSTM